MKLTPIVRYYKKNTNYKRLDLNALDDIKWQTDMTMVESDNYEFVFNCVRDVDEECSVAIQIAINDWSLDNYVLMPAAVYNGNRFETYKMDYPPIIKVKEAFKVDMPIHQNDVPRLNINPGNSRIQLLAGDMSTPCIAIFFKDKKESLMIFGSEQILGYECGYEIEETQDRKRAFVTVMAPGVRSGLKYYGMKMETPSDDRGVKFKCGESVTLPLGIYKDKCEDIEEFFQLYINHREKYYKGDVINDLPLSKAFEFIEDKYNKYNWFNNDRDKDISFYTVGIGEGINNCWQTGWIGGGMVTESFLIDGLDISKERGAKNLSFMLKKLMAPTGFLYSCFDGERAYCDCFEVEHNYNMCLIRKNADILYFIMKQLPYLSKLGVNVDYKDKIKALADAFVKLWDRYGQFGQFIDIETGDILVGNSLSSSTAIGGLALSYEYFGDNEYKRVAKESCEYYYKNYTKIGITNGGPGEIFAACDSESAAGILESYITLYNVFKDEKYIEYAKSAANQLLSWVMSYDFAFPKTSLFGKWDIKTDGSVFANVQNKHSAPGYCTLSGDSLFELYRLTGNEIYLNSIKATAHNISSYLITEKRKKTTPEIAHHITNTMNERVETSDWLEPVGEIFEGSCWCEASCALTYTEIPGLYINKEKDLIVPIDHIEVVDVYKSPFQWILSIKNPTDYDMKLKIFTENHNYRINYMTDYKIISISKGETVKYKG